MKQIFRSVLLIVSFSIMLSGLSITSVFAQQYTGKGAPVDMSTGLPAVTFPIVTDGTIYASIPDGSGGWFIGGSFTTIGGVTRDAVAHIKADGTLDEVWNANVGAGGIVYALAIGGTGGSRLYLGGSFSIVGGIERNNIAGVTVSTGSLDSWYLGNGASGTIYAIVKTFSSNMVLGGDFSYVVGSNTYVNLIQINNAGTIATKVSDFNPVNGTIYTLLFGTQLSLWIGGDFTTVMDFGVPAERNRIARLYWNVDFGYLLTGWNPNADATVRTIQIATTDYSPDVFLGGDFTYIGGEVRNHLARINWDGLATVWDPNVSGTTPTVYSISLEAPDSTILYVGGNFSSIGTETRNNVAALEASTGNPTNWEPNPDNQVRTVSAKTGFVYVGGEFDNMGTSQPSTFQLTVNIENNWNMVSIPGLHPVDQNVDTWWPGKVTGSTVWEFLPSGYNGVTVLEPTKGYWMKNNGAQTYNTGDEWPSGGILYVDHDPITVAAGWNMIGGYECNVSVPGGFDPQPTGTVWGFDATGYYAATELVPGFGYWAKFGTAGQVTLTCTTLKGVAKTVNKIDDNWGRIIITDNNGRSYKLYAVSGEVNLSNFELPPLPPSGLFDVRYGSNRVAEDLSSGQTIDMQGVKYPVKVRVEGITLKLQDASGEIVNANLRSGEEVTINNSSINKLVILSGEVTAPIEYSLEQNYPNPFNPSTTIKFSIPEATNVTLSIFNVLGEKVTDLVNSKLEAGKYSYSWNPSNAATGLYIYELRTDNFVSMKKMLLLK